MSEKTKKVLTIIGIYFVAFTLARALSPLGGKLHLLFWKRYGCGGWGPCDSGAHLEGFIYLFIYLLAVVSFALLKQKTAWKVYLWGTGLFWILDMYIIITEDYERSIYVGGFIIMLVALALGYGTGIGIKKLIEKFKKVK